MDQQSSDKSKKPLKNVSASQSKSLKSERQIYNFFANMLLNIEKIKKEQEKKK